MRLLEGEFKEGDNIVVSAKEGKINFAKEKANVAG